MNKNTKNNIIKDIRTGKITVRFYMSCFCGGHYPDHDTYVLFRNGERIGLLFADFVAPNKVEFVFQDANDNYTCFEKDITKLIRRALERDDPEFMTEIKRIGQEKFNCQTYLFGYNWMDWTRGRFLSGEYYETVCDLEKTF